MHNSKLRKMIRNVLVESGFVDPSGPSAEQDYDMSSDRGDSRMRRGKNLRMQSVTDEALNALDQSVAFNTALDRFLRTCVTELRRAKPGNPNPGSLATVLSDESDFGQEVSSNIVFSIARSYAEQLVTSD